MGGRTSSFPTINHLDPDKIEEEDIQEVVKATEKNCTGLQILSTDISSFLPPPISHIEPPTPQVPPRKLSRLVPYIKVPDHPRWAPETIAFNIFNVRRPFVPARFGFISLPVPLRIPEACKAMYGWEQDEVDVQAYLPRKKRRRAGGNTGRSDPSPPSFFSSVSLSDLEDGGMDVLKEVWDGEFPEVRMTYAQLIEAPIKKSTLKAKRKPSTLDASTSQPEARDLTKKDKGKGKAKAKEQEQEKRVVLEMGEEDVFASPGFVALDALPDPNQPSTSTASHIPRAPNRLWPPGPLTTIQPSYADSNEYSQSRPRKSSQRALQFIKEVSQSELNSERSELELTSHTTRAPHLDESVHDRSVYSPSSTSSTRPNHKHKQRKASKLAIESIKRMLFPIPDHELVEGAYDSANPAQLRRLPIPIIASNLVSRTDIKFDEGTICHQCRSSSTKSQETMRCRTILSEGVVCPLEWCKSCIERWYLVEFNPYAIQFVCPRCQGVCSCSVCRLQNGTPHVPISLDPLGKAVYPRARTESKKVGKRFFVGKDIWSKHKKDEEREGAPWDHDTDTATRWIVGKPLPADTSSYLVLSSFIPPREPQFTIPRVDESDITPSVYGECNLLTPHDSQSTMGPIFKSYSMGMDMPISGIDFTREASNDMGMEEFYPPLPHVPFGEYPGYNPTDADYSAYFGLNPTGWPMDRAGYDRMGMWYPHFGDGVTIDDGDEEGDVDVDVVDAQADVEWNAYVRVVSGEEEEEEEEKEEKEKEKEDAGLESGSSTRDPPPNSNQTHSFTNEQLHRAVAAGLSASGTSYTFAP